MDLIYLLLSTAFFALSALLAKFCGKLKEMG